MTQTPEAAAERNARCRKAAREFLEGTIGADVLFDRVLEEVAELDLDVLGVEVARVLMVVVGKHRAPRRMVRVTFAYDDIRPSRPDDPMKVTSVHEDDGLTITTFEKDARAFDVGTKAIVKIAARGRG